MGGWYDPFGWFPGGGSSGGTRGTPTIPPGPTSLPGDHPQPGTPPTQAQAQGQNYGPPGGAPDLPSTGLFNSSGPTSNIPNADQANFNLPGYSERDHFFNSEAGGAQSRLAPQSADSSFRGDQQALVDRLRGQMNGQDSMSNLQLRGATDQNIAQQHSLAAGASPGNAAMAQRLMGQNIGNINQGFGAQAAQLGIQERNAAANALAGVAGQGRGQDLQNNQFNVGAQLQQRGMNDQYGLGMGQLSLGNAVAQQHGNMGYETNQTQRRGQDLNIPVQPAPWERVANAAGDVAPYLKYMAEGGVVTRPTNAVIGEAGPEAVIPLDRPDKWAMLAQMQSGPTQKMGQMANDPFRLREPGDTPSWMQGSLGKPGTIMPKGPEQAMGGSPDASPEVKMKKVETLRNAFKPQEQKQPQKPLDSPAWRQLVASILQPMAEGGVVTRPTPALVGESGPEAVIPLEKLPDLVSRIKAQGPTPSTTYGPPAPPANYGPPAPAGPTPWRPANAHEQEIFRAGRQWSDNATPSDRFPGEMKAMTKEQWAAFLHGMGVQ